MNIGRAIFIGFCVAGCAALLWFGNFVISAYITEPEAVSIKLRGVNLVSEETEIEPTPYRVSVAPDTRNNAVALAFVDQPRVTETVIPVVGGDSTLRGSITGPDGLGAAGALVRLERHTLNGSGSLTVTADDLGFWEARNLLGGRYRVRAWVPNQLTVDESQVLFLNDNSPDEFELKDQEPLQTEKVVQEVDFTLRGAKDDPIVEIFDGGSRYLNHSGLMAVSISRETIDAEGILTVSPMSGIEVLVSARTGVEVSGATAVSVGSNLSNSSSSNSSSSTTSSRNSSTLVAKSNRTDISGVARFSVECKSLGLNRVVVNALGRSQLFGLDPCLPPVYVQPEPTVSTVDQTSRPETSEQGPNR